MNLKNIKPTVKNFANLARSGVLEPSSLSLFKKEVILDSINHYEAGIITLSHSLYSSLSKNDNFSKESTSALTSISQLHKTQYYSNLTLKSENAYLKSQVSELEGDIKKMYDCNRKMNKVNQNLETKLGFYQKKMHCFTNVSNQIVELINSVFKKVGNHLLESQQSTFDSDSSRQSPNQKAKEQAKFQVNNVFRNEMNELKMTFKNLQKRIDSLNEEYLNLKNLSVADGNRSFSISKILDSMSSQMNASNNETMSKIIKPNDTILLQSSIGHIRKPSQFVEEVEKGGEYSKYDLPLSHRSTLKPQTPIKISQKNTPPSSNGRETILEVSLSPAQEKIEKKQIVKENPKFYQLQRNNIPPTKMSSLRNEIHRRIAEKNANTSRHSSTHRTSYLNNSGLTSHRESVRNPNNLSNLNSINPTNIANEPIENRNLINSKSQLNRNSSEKAFVNMPVPSQTIKVSLQNRRSERHGPTKPGKSLERHFSYGGEKLDKNNFLAFGDFTMRFEKNELNSIQNEYPLQIEPKEANKENIENRNLASHGTVSSARDSYENLKSFRKLIQNFRVDLNKVGSNDINIQKTGLYRELNLHKTKR